MLVCAAPLALAYHQNPPAKRVRVSIVIILASETDTRVDPKLKCIAHEVRKLDPKLKGFRMTKMSWVSLPLGKPDTFMVEGQPTTITVQKAADKMDRIELAVGPPMMGEITYSTPCGKFLPILTLIQTRKGEKVILAIRVQPCQKK
jgi:hypothetical protein